MIEPLSLLWHYAQAVGRFRHWSDRDELTAWQENQVQEHLSAIAGSSPYFRSLAREHGMAHWREWPVQSKAEMMKHFDEWNSAGIRLDEASALAMEAEQTRDFSATFRGITVGLSSGTSGSRGIFLASPAERRLWAGTLLARTLRGTLHRRHRAALFLRADSPLYQTVGSRRFRFAFFDIYQPLETHLARLKELRPTILAAPPSVLVQIAAEPAAGDLLSPPYILLSVADVLDDADRVRIEAGFGHRVGQIYQATEGFLAATCPHGRLHWNEDAITVQKQWLDSARTRYCPIITDFRRTTQPIIRYRLDDVITEDTRPACACGSLFGTLGSIEGRCDEVLELQALNGTGQVSIYPDFVRRAVVLALPVGAEYTVTATNDHHWIIGLSSPASADRVREEVAALCARMKARTPEISFTTWSPPAAGGKRRRVRRLKTIAP